MEGVKKFFTEQKGRIFLTAAGITLIAAPAIGCADSGSKTTRTAQSLEIQKEENYKIIKIQDNLYYVGPPSLTSSLYYGEDLALGLKKLGEQFDLIDEKPIFGGGGRFSSGGATVTEGYLVTVGPKQTPKP